MVVQAEQTKRDEQHPLLKVDTTGPGGDMGLPPRPPTTLTPGWNVACVPKRSWLDRWPEFISACWMSFILLGITFLVFYALGMSAYRRQSLIIVKCNTSKPENNVYFHHVIPRGSYLPFSLYSDYLSSMAMEYPFLNFNVHFLIDDAHDPAYGVKHSRLFKRLSQPMLSDMYSAAMNERDKQELKMFQQRFGNMNITIMTVSHYMTTTSLKCKWKMIPTVYLPFYARIFSVWEYGGIGLDLISLNNQFNNNQMPDQRITAILRQHNDGIEEKKYIQTLNTINMNHQEQAEFFNLFYNLMSNIFAKSDAFFDNSLFELPVPTKTNNNVVTVSRNYRNKRENSEVIANKTNKIKINENIVEHTNNRNISNSEDFNGKIMNTSFDKTKLMKNNSLVVIKQNFTSENKLQRLENKINVTKVDNEIPHVILFYDFSVFPDGIIGPSYSIPEASHMPKLPKKPKASPSPLSIAYDGTFVAATSPHHPFLCHVLSSISNKVSPRLAIENTLAIQCPGMLRNDEYCDNIYILN